MILFSPLEPATGKRLVELARYVETLFPVPARFRASLPQTVAELSGLLTAARGSRNKVYLNDPALLSAYLRYFLPWNVYRLCRLLPNVPLTLVDGDAITDLGSGPLVFPLALWIARPDLHKVQLEFRCVDWSGAALDAGRKIFSAFAASAWHIKTIRAPLDTPIRGQKAALVTAIMVFNEEYEHIPHRLSLDGTADTITRLVVARTSAAGKILVVEPGVPRSGEFIACLRSSLHSAGFPPVSPCPHTGACPSAGGDTKWCHFAFGTDDAPQGLHKLSAAAGLPKERATVSFVLAGGDAQPDTGIRVMSDAFPVGHGRYGRYACSERGLILLAGEKTVIETYRSGSLAPVPALWPQKRDNKTGALMLEVQKDFFPYPSR
jgi:hypothetical protein